MPATVMRDLNKYTPRFDAMRINLFIAIFFLTSVSIAQQRREIPTGFLHNYKILPNDEPDIHVTSWILNPPKDKTFKNRYIVLNYWCDSPVCIHALNEVERLCDSLSNEKRLLFVTYSNKDSITTLAQLNKYKIKTNTIVVSNTRRCDKLWSNGIDHIRFPFLLLIDDKGKVIWVTAPSSITKEILDKFLKNDLTPATSFR